VKIFALTLFALATFFSAAVRAEEKVPAGSSEIYQTIDSLWKDKQFDVIELYLSDILDDWPNYVPAMLAEIKRLQLDGAQYEKSLTEARKIKRVLEDYPLDVNPGFYELFLQNLKRSEEALDLFLNQGIGKKERKQKFQLENNWRPRSSWSQELLFLSAPAASASDWGFHLWRSPPSSAEGFQDLSEQDLQKKAFDLSISDAERLAVSKELAERYIADGLQGIVDALSHPCCFLVAPHLVEEFWDLAQDITDDEILQIFKDNHALMEGSVLWVLAKAPPEQTQRSKMLVEKYAKTVSEKSHKQYADNLISALEKSETANSPVQNGGRPSPPGLPPFGRGEKEVPDNAPSAVAERQSISFFWVALLVTLVAGGGVLYLKSRKS